MIDLTTLRPVALWTGLNLAWMLALAIHVARLRGKHHIGFGDGGEVEIQRAIRAHGNTVEYVPGLLVGFALMALLGAPAWEIHVLGAGLLAARVSHAVGITTNKPATRPRQIGIVGTWGITLWVIYVLVRRGLF
ncbi:MAG: MAPEG family protein [Myxococcales bacterium]|nr:MAPEG family protein [Myxococcales bacterium]